VTASDLRDPVQLVKYEYWAAARRLFQRAEEWIV
jgi:hypothetical protein